MRCAAIAVVFVAATAHAQVDRLTMAMGEIRAHVHALRYHEARGAAEAALALGEAGPGELATLYRILGEVNAGLDDITAAASWFTRLLAIDPEATLPAGSSPKLTGPFQAARLAASPIAIRVTVSAGAALIRADDRGGVVRGARLRVVRDGRERPPLDAALDTPVAIDVGDGDVIFADARDEHGNRIATTGVRVAAAARSRWRSPLPYAIAGGVAAAAGGVLVWRRSVALDDLDAIIADSDSYTFEDARAAERRAERYGWLAVTGAGVAAIAGAFAIGFAVTSDTELVVSPWTNGIAARVTF